MAKYEKNPTGKYQCPECDYGHDKGKSRQSVSNHYNKIHANENTLKIEEPLAANEVGGTIPPFEAETPTNEDIGVLDDSTPEWLNIEYEEGDEVKAESIPPIAKGFLKTFAGHAKSIPKGQKEIAAFMQQQAKIVRWFLSGMLDPLVSWWGRGMLADPTFTIERSDDEWRMVESITQQWLEYRGIVIPVSPDMVMVGCLSAMYVPTIAKVYRNKSPNRKLGIWGKWRKRRALRKAMREEEDESQ